MSSLKYNSLVSAEDIFLSVSARDKALLKVAEDRRRDNSKRDINRFVTVAGNQPAELSQLRLWVEQTDDSLTSVSVSVSDSVSVSVSEADGK